MNVQYTNSPKRAQRLDHASALDLLVKAPMGELMALAHAERMRRHPDGQVTFVYDTNPNYTNICVTQCRFCAFCRSAGDSEAYTLSPQIVANRVEKAVAAGATTVLLQGGHNPKIGLKDWLAYIQAIKSKTPNVHIHPFSPAEYVFMAQTEQCAVRDVLMAVYAEGIRTIPGGGAEILVEDVRQQIDCAQGRERTDIQRQFRAAFGQ